MLTEIHSFIRDVIFILLGAGIALYLLVCFYRMLVSVCLWRLKRGILAVLLAVATVTTIIAQKDRTGGTGTTDIPPVGEQQIGTTGFSPVVNELDNTLHFSSICVHTNDTATLTVAWPVDLITTNSTIDILAATSLVNSVWVWQCDHVVAEGETNWVETVSATSNRRFYKAVVRNTLIDMDDPDGDGLPNAYELAHHTNPWQADFETVPRLTVGDGGQFATLQAALDESETYSVIAITSGVYQVNHGILMPPHPVMVTCEDGYAVFSGATGRAMFLLGSGHESGHTLFRSLYLNLTATNGMQAGFWCGGSLPWVAPGAAAVFENVHIRAPNLGVEYFGWLFYAPCDVPSVIRRCCVNASGAEWIYAIFGDNPPPIVVESCSFVNFPTQSVYQSTAIGLRSTHANGAIAATPSVTVSRVLFDASFTNAWSLARFENAGDFPVTMTDSIIPEVPALSDFLPTVTDNMHIVTSEVAWAGFPLADSPAAALGVGAFAPIANDPLADMDNDGLPDYEEVYEHGTDPFLADSDNDGVTDDVELNVDGTDPTDPHSFVPTVTVTVTNTASMSHAVYTAWGYSATDWETNGLESFMQGFGSTNYTDVILLDETYAKAYCDLNDNGAFDAASDILLVGQIPYGSAPRLKFTFGDVDGDGVPDAQERQQETDPYNGNNFRLVATVNVASSDVVPGLTNYVAWGHMPTGWEENGLDSFAGRSLPFPVDVPVMNGELFVKVFRDFNKNGVYDVGVDALVSNRLMRTDNGKTVTFNIGDSDEDKIPDSLELDEGTDPLDKLSYCFNLSLTYTGVFQTTNALTFAASFGTNRVSGPCVVEGSVWTNDFGHRITTTGERVSVDVWDDANQNDDWDVGETSNKYTIALTAHDMVMTNALSYGNFDRDNNELPDWWEEVTGLNSVTNGGPYADTDGDGLNNLHEYWAGTEPLVPDGSNTLLSVISRSIDDRIKDKSPDGMLQKFLNYHINGTNGVFVLNPDCWANDIDTSCVSMWNNSSGSLRAGVAISKRHILVASHFYHGNGVKVFFREPNGNIHTNVITGRRQVNDTDVMVQALRDELPDTIIPACILPPNYQNFIGGGKCWPVLRFDQDERCVACEISRAVPFEATYTPDRHEQSFATTAPLVGLRQPYYIHARGGDSGNPSFLVVGNKVVLLGVLHGGHYEADGITVKIIQSPFVTYYADGIQAAMDILIPGYTLRYLDCSGYPQLERQEGR